MKRILVVLVLSIVVLGVLPFGSVSALNITGFNPELTCQGIIVVSEYKLSYDRDNTGNGFEKTHLEVIDGNGSILYAESGPAPLGTVINGFPRGFVFPYWHTPDANPIVFRWYSDAGNGLPEVLVFEKQGECEGLPWGNLGGCDQIINIPSDAANGRFVANAAVYSAPGEMVSPPVVIEVGKAYLVAGQDESGMYRKVLVGCAWVWVEADAVGPDYDPSWNGAPLPTTVVE